MMDEVTRRLDYLLDRMKVDGLDIVMVTADDYTQVTDLPYPIDRYTGWTSIALGADGQAVTVMSPELIVATTGWLPWSPEPEETDLVLDDSEPGDHREVCPLDEATRTDQRCEVCDAVHRHTVAPVVDYELVDSPDPEPYLFFDNYVRVIRWLLESEMLALREAELTGPLTLDQRRALAWDCLHRMPAGHPAVHRFVLTVQSHALGAGVS